MEQEALSIIFSRRHPRIAEKTDIWKLESDCYSGGVNFIAADHLIQHSRESQADFDKRKDGSKYYNYVQPLADMLAGFLYAENVEREIPDSFKYLIEKASKQKSLNAFIQNLSIQSLLYTCGVLVDSPAFDPAKIKTQADRRAAGLDPYCVIYYPWHIRDFHIGEGMELDWILLDNTVVDNSDVLADPVIKETYRLWTKTEYTDYHRSKDAKGKLQYTEDEPVLHNLGKVPFVFSNWRDVDEDYITESPFEDIALLSRAIYNMVSCETNMVTDASFKALFYPIEDMNDIPKQLMATGIGSITVCPYNGTLSQKPFFDGPDIQSVEQYSTIVMRDIKEILSKIGLDKDHDKQFVQSGKAKSLEFEKCEAILRLGAEQLQSVELKIFEFAALWEGTIDATFEITYTKKFQSEDIDIQLSRLWEAFSMPYASVQKEAAKEIVSKIFRELSPESIKKLTTEIENQKPVEPINVNDLEGNELDSKNENTLGGDND